MLWWEWLFELNFLLTHRWAFLVMEQILRNLQVNTNVDNLSSVNNDHSVASWNASSILSTVRVDFAQVCLPHISSVCWLVVSLITLFTTIALINWVMWLEQCTAALSWVSRVHWAHEPERSAAGDVPVQTRTEEWSVIWSLWTVFVRVCSGGWKPDGRWWWWCHSFVLTGFLLVLGDLCSTFWESKTHWFIFLLL